MAQYLVQGSTLTAIADAIREKGKIYNNLTPAQMPSYIKNNLLSTGDVDYILDRTIVSISNSTCTKLGAYAFAGCTNLNTINMPKVSSVGTSAFYQCTPAYVTLGLTQIADNVVANSPEVAILANNTNLINLNLPSCTAIYSSVCTGATNLVSISVPNVDILTKHAFSGCTALTEVSLPKCGTTTTYGIGTAAFAKCTSLSKVYAPMIKSLNANAFSGCTALKEFYAPQMVGTSDTPFAGVTTLESVTIGYATIPAWSATWPNLAYFSDSAATAISAAAFSGCTKLKAQNFHAPNVAAIPQSAFRNGGFTYANSTVFPKVAGTIGNYAFYQCASLSYVNLPNVTSLGNGVFKGCTTLKSVTLPALTSVAVTSTHSTFADCPNLQSIHLNNYNAPIVRYLFYNNTALKTVSVPKATTVEAYAFQLCTALSTISLPAVNNIKGSAFLSCTALTSVDVGTATAVKVTFAASAFKGTGLNTLRIRYTSLASLANVNAFAGTGITSTTGSIYVPTAWVASYKAATNWKTFATQIIGF